METTTIRRLLPVAVLAILAGCAHNAGREAQRRVAQLPAADRETIELAHAERVRQLQNAGIPDAAIPAILIGPREGLISPRLPPPGERGLFDEQPMGWWCQGEPPGCMARLSYGIQADRARFYYPGTAHFRPGKGLTWSRGIPPTDLAGTRPRSHVTRQTAARAMNTYPCAELRERRDPLPWTLCTGLAPLGARR